MRGGDGSGLMLYRAQAGSEQAGVGCGRAALVASHDQEILRLQRGRNAGIGRWMLDVRIDRARAVAIAGVAADAPVGAADADRPAQRRERAAAGPAAVGARRDDAAIADEAIARG